MNFISKLQAPHYFAVIALISAFAEPALAAGGTFKALITFCRQS